MNPEGYFINFIENDYQQIISYFIPQISYLHLVYPREFIFQFWDFNSVGQSG
jgi:hypothetical protein